MWPIFKAMFPGKNNTDYPKWESSAVDPDKAVRYFEEYKKDPQLAELLKGKRVAFVCPSPHLNEMGLGKLIDSYDLVIRAGTLSPIPERLHEDCGSRTDIVVHSFNEFEIDEAYRNLYYLATMKFVLLSMVSTDFKDAHTDLLSKLAKEGALVQNVSDQYLYKVAKEVGTMCNCGFFGLMTLLNYDIKEIFVAGMGFYNMGNYGNVYNSDYYQQVTDVMKIFTPNDERQITYEEARGDLHRQQPQIDYLGKLLRRDKRISVDAWLQDKLLGQLSWLMGIKDKELHVDIDGILCISAGRFTSGPYKGELDYNQSTPLINNIDVVNYLYDNNKITLWTARGKRTGMIDWGELTLKQMEQWGVRYHDISFNKPHYDLFWDDKTAFDKKSFIEQLETLK